MLLVIYYLSLQALQEVAPGLHLAPGRGWALGAILGLLQAAWR